MSRIFLSFNISICILVIAMYIGFIPRHCICLILRVLIVLMPEKKTNQINIITLARMHRC